jgi:hypothetical protein
MRGGEVERVALRGGARVLVRAVAAWILFLALSYVALSALYVDLERLALRAGLEWEGMPYGMAAHKFVLASWGVALLGFAAGVQLWRMRPSGRVVGIAYLAFVGLYALAQSWLQRDVAAIAFGAFNLWLASVLLRKDAARACRSGEHTDSASAAGA